MKTKVWMSIALAGALLVGGLVQTALFHSHVMAYDPTDPVMKIQAANDPTDPVTVSPMKTI